MVNNDNFSARWQKNQYFVAGKYKFSTTTDDGVRLYIDGVLKIDKWINQGPTTYATEVDLSNGEHEIKMEYYEGGGSAVAKLDWIQLSVAPPPPPPPPPPVAGNFYGEYFNNTNLQGTPTLTRNDPTVDFSWADDSPHATINTDNFSARWNKVANFTEGMYTFEVTADDGIRLYVDNKIVLDKWKDQPPTSYKVDLALNAGNHALKLEYYERGGGAQAKLAYAKSQGFTGKYWNYSGTPAIPSEAPILTREDALINFNWGQNSPGASINSDMFVAQWERMVNFDSGNYIFSMTADDGIRIFIDDALVLDKWRDQPPTNYTVTRYFDSPGQYKIKVDYYERYSGTVARLGWTKTELNSGLWNADYFDNKTLSGPPKFTQTVPQINFNWGTGSPDSTIPANNFSASFTKQINLAEGEYSFVLAADDGIRFWVDDVLVIDDWTDHSVRTYYPSIRVANGDHTFKVEFYENGGDAFLMVGQ
jgi:hypothetical protein